MCENLKSALLKKICFVISLYFQLYNWSSVISHNLDSFSENGTNFKKNLNKSFQELDIMKIVFCYTPH